MKTTRGRVDLGVAALVVLFAGVAPQSRGGEDATAPTEGWIAPTRSAKRKNPVPAEPASAARGQVLYGRECLACHGGAGKGDGPQAKDLEKKPGDLTGEAAAGQTDGALFWKITSGRKPMPSYEKLLTEQERWDLVNYLRVLAPQEPEKTAPEAGAQEGGGR